MKAESNSSSILFSNIQKFNKNRLYKTSSFIFYNLDTNLNFLKILSKKLDNLLDVKKTPLKNIFWFNNYKPSTKIWFNNYFKYNFVDNFFFIPTLNSLEFKGIFLNLEEKPQQTQTLKINSYPTLKTIIEWFLTKNENYEKVNNIIKLSQNEYTHTTSIFNIREHLELAFLFELLNNDTLFDEIKTKFSTHFNTNFETVVSSKNFKYPFKNYIDDFYKTNSFTENSYTMTKCSRELRKISSNF